MKSTTVRQNLHNAPYPVGMAIEVNLSNVYVFALIGTKHDIDCEAGNHQDCACAVLQEYTLVDMRTFNRWTDKRLYLPSVTHPEFSPEGVKEKTLEYLQEVFRDEYFFPYERDKTTITVTVEEEE